MPDQWQQHPIDFTATFTLREPVLAATGSLRNRWRVVEGGKALEIDLPLTSYSPHERDAIEFAINPYTTGQNIFNNLDPDIRRALATALYKLFGPGGTEDRPDA
jgi:hypothetical protein